MQWSGIHKNNYAAEESDYIYSYSNTGHTARTATEGIWQGGCLIEMDVLSYAVWLALTGEKGPGFDSWSEH
ncbi:hypothetical protein Pmar_PMAR023129 [Perkinsus marinus ATCC 50983]|uniref:Uncharacterized protein n=1 Tax=Perkinsus marinus (strain ATCC 50983 / TXsc) TaxID=423536 RepID=C5LE49_PERM5|nr:hypothetical protein Pmar_PMAR023129 [Perkinsus marinus ATCC 50983]EER04989.1 hypothetical protein Pmar_PMAR023129 [Perkinsus marinus ATCC 50983]|eukprot:XP_002773173.1 hypothetical protein Pmar_PMAR023129 [Perkinsus marinus ATCC 50983]